MSRSHQPPRFPGVRSTLGLALLAATLAGCDGGDDAGGAASGLSDSPAADIPGGGSSDIPPVAVETTTITVTPSLGQVFAGTVRVIAPGGGGQEVAELARGQTNGNGNAEVEVPADTEGPVIVEVSGNEAASYYDEGSDSPAPLEEGDVIRAVVPEVPAEGAPVGVTPLTEMAVRYLEAQHGSLASMTREELAALVASGAVEEAYAKIRAELAPELGDTSLLSVPTVVGSAADVAQLGTSPADLYALKLAALARVAHGRGAARPMLAITRELGDDLADGVFDGNHGLATLAVQTYDIHTLASELQAAAGTLASSQELKDLLGALDRYVSDLIAALAIIDNGGGDNTDPGEVIDDIVDDIVEGPGDLLASWHGDYNGSWQHGEVRAWVKVPIFGWQRDYITEETLKASTAVMVGLLGNGCHWNIDTGKLKLGLLQAPFGEAFAAAAVGDARTYTLPVSISVLDISLAGATVMETQGVLPTRIALDYAYKGLVREFSYHGACTFSYSS